MILVISPAKTLDYTTTDYEKSTEARLLDYSDKLIKVLEKKSVKQLQKLMDISEELAILNAERYQSYERPFHEHLSKQAILAFKGDVYIGLEAENFEEEDFQFAQDHLRILSGLYGVLRPLDEMFPYRLEMGTGLKVGRKKNLYEFWGDKITDLLNEDIKNSDSKYLINLASIEYFKSVNKKKIKAKIINVHFQEDRNGKLKTISFNAKKARGGMARQIILEKIIAPELIKELVVDDYRFKSEISTESEFFFTK